MSRAAQLLVLLAILLLAIPASAQESHGFTPCTGNQPAFGSSISSVSSNVQLRTCGPTVILYNITSQEAFYSLGASSSTVATTSSSSLPGNTYVVLSVPWIGTGYFLAAITSTSTTTIRVVQGTSN